MCLAALLPLSGCGRSDTGADADASAPPAAATADAPALAPAGAAFDTTWQGVLPCADCDGIQTRLRLVSDDQGRRYELQEAYLASDGGDVFETQGTFDEGTATLDGQATVAYRLDTAGASRWFAVQPDGALEMLEGPDRATADGLAHRLQRM